MADEIAGRVRGLLGDVELAVETGFEPPPRAEKIRTVSSVVPVRLSPDAVAD